MTKVAAYIRTSLENQGQGLDSQERAIKEYLTNHGMDATFYRDELSGATTDRPALKRLQADVFKGKVNVVIVWKLDRISRSLKDGINILSGWLEKDVRVIAVAQQLDFTGPVGQMVAAVLFALAAMERENIRENTRRGMAAAKARGAVIGKRPTLFAKDIVPLLQDGMSLSAAARHLKKSRQAIYDCLQREGVDVTSLIAR
ncbi:recombinase family protein [Lacipirellula limnantheis]|uniref:Transposon Tn3 resolvase n=1 Tax=Lacipirellula limnantheis TaxID=2528024 RepID=A0A517U5V9_9BACT|nr:recombinase family protein [Lacipirellula limnantheis]QDT76018.1 Transposon Tn3 resolvase [Lacipirellula limnantheis]